MKLKVRSHDTPTHIVKSLKGQAAIVDIGRDILPEERCATIPVDTAGHIHVLSSVGSLITTVSRAPVGHYIALKSELVFEDAVQCLTVLTAVRAVDALVRAHDRRSVRFDSVLKGPGVYFVHCLIVDVG